MKGNRIFAGLLAMGLAIASLSAWAGETPLIAYFSRTGNTKFVAQEIAKHTKGDLFEIVPKEPYTDEDINYKDKTCRANREMKDPLVRPAIANKIPDFKKYKTIYLGYPTWWGTMPRIINTFLESYDFKGKKVYLFTTSGSSGIEQSMQDIKGVIPNAIIKDGFRLPAATARSSQEEIKNWIKKK